MIAPSPERRPLNVWTFPRPVGRCSLYPRRTRWPTAHKLVEGAKAKEPRSLFGAADRPRGFGRGRMLTQVEEIDNLARLIVPIACRENREPVGLGDRSQVGRAGPIERFDPGLRPRRFRREPGGIVSWSVARVSNDRARRRRLTIGRLSAGEARARSAGRTKRRNPTIPLTGFPGSPKTSVPGASPRGGPTPNQSGLPGLTWTLWNTQVTPRLWRTSGTRSRLPAETPP